jgi:hypothetical protein
MKADAWVNSAALLNRMNFGLALAAGKLPGIQWNPAATVNEDQMPTDPTGALANFENALLDGDVSKQTHATILNQLNDPQAVSASVRKNWSKYGNHEKSIPEGWRDGAGGDLGDPELPHPGSLWVDGSHNWKEAFGSALPARRR